MQFAHLLCKAYVRICRCSTSSVVRNHQFHTSHYDTTEMSISILQTFISWVSIYCIFAGLWRFYFTYYTMPGFFLFLWIVWGSCNFPSKLLKQGYVNKRSKSSLRRFYVRWRNPAVIQKTLRSITWLTKYMRGVCLGGGA